MNRLYLITTNDKKFDDWGKATKKKLKKDEIDLLMKGLS